MENIKIVNGEHITPKIQLLDKYKSQLGLFQHAYRCEITHALHDSGGVIDNLDSSHLLSYADLSARIMYVNEIRGALSSLLHTCLDGLGIEHKYSDFNDTEEYFKGSIKYTLFQDETILKTLPIWMKQGMEEIARIDRKGDELFDSIFENVNFSKIVDGEMVKMEAAEIGDRNLDEYLKNLELSSLVDTWEKDISEIYKVTNLLEGEAMCKAIIELL